MNKMIPKIIHYCWFGGNPLPKLAQRCIASWEKYCPDYEIIEWNEQNVDISSFDYMQQAYEEKAWGFVPDIARLQIIYDHGGIYLDTDVELLKPLDNLLKNDAFMGIEDGKRVALGLGFGAEKGNLLIKKMLDDYSHRSFRNADGTLNRTPSPKIQTSLLKRFGFIEEDVFQRIEGIAIYPSEYFCPKSFQTQKINITEKTYSIHHFDGSWLTEYEKVMMEKRCEIHKKTGPITGVIWPFVVVFMSLKYYGLSETFAKMKKKLVKMIIGS